MKKVIVVLVLLLSLVACSSPGPADKDSAAIKAANDTAKAAVAKADSYKAIIDSQAKQITELQKQLAELGNRQNAYALKSELAAQQAQAGNVADLKARLSAVEGQLSQYKANNDILRNELNTKLTGMQGTIDSLAAMFQGTSQVTTKLLKLEADVADIKVRISNHGW